MIERVVENWLTSTNERGYEVPFCQLLLSQGHSVVHLSTHGMMEQGKDVITIGPDGVPCAYQLKAGNIGVVEWREIYSEVEELVALPIRHPSIPKAKKHRAFLVTNGLINDPAQDRIRALNDKSRRRGDTLLATIVKHQLLADFIRIHGHFLPVELKDVREFLQLYLSTGESPIRKPEMSTFLCSILMEHHQRSQQQFRRAIASAVILNGYLVGNHSEKKNHFALFEAWILLAAHVLAVAERYRLSEKHWAASFELSMTAAVRSLNDLKEEVLARKHFVEGDGFVDGPVYRCRMTVILGCLAALEIHNRLTNSSPQRDDRILKFIGEHRKDLQFWGESATPFFLAIAWYLESFVSSREAESFLLSLTYEIARSNQPAKKTGLPSPYYDVENSLRSVSGIGDLQSKFDKETFVCRRRRECVAVWPV